MEARLRAKTDLPGLYLTGQDVLDSGVVSAAFSGALTAQVIPSIFFTENGPLN